MFPIHIYISQTHISNHPPINRVINLGFHTNSISVGISIIIPVSFQRLNFTDWNILSNLTENNIVGSGRSGKVYRIPTNQGQFVAVKKIWNNKMLDHRLEKEFLAEVQILGTIRHSNIVKLWCCISSENSKLLVYEYMENQSLDRWLHGKKRKSLTGEMVMDWPRRLKIAIGAAQGLSYMHHDCSPPVIHRDVKSSNILLDSEFKARIADFGLAKMLEKHGESRTMSAVAGSFGYFAPGKSILLIITSFSESLNGMIKFNHLTIISYTY